MKAIYIQPQEEAMEIDMNGTLDTLEELLNGAISFVELDEDAVIVCNADMRYAGLETNRQLDDGTAIYGGFLITGRRGKRLCSLTDEQIDGYIERFGEPEYYHQYDDMACCEFAHDLIKMLGKMNPDEPATGSIMPEILPFPTGGECVPLIEFEEPPVPPMPPQGDAGASIVINVFVGA